MDDVAVAQNRSTAAASPRFYTTSRFGEHANVVGHLEVFCYLGVYKVMTMRARGDTTPTSSSSSEGASNRDHHSSTARA